MDELCLHWFKRFILIKGKVRLKYSSDVILYSIVDTYNISAFHYHVLLHHLDRTKHTSYSLTSVLEEIVPAAISKNSSVPHHSIVFESNTPINLTLLKQEKPELFI